VQRPKQQPKQLRAENGRQVKVVATAKPSAVRKAQPAAQKVKVAAR